METQIRKKKKVQSHKVTLQHDKLEKNSFQVRGVDSAYFPYDPYPQQSSLIKQINMAIKSKENALIESPTGTGKTLCMLVGSLSSLCKLSQEENPKVPKVYYLTRTHSQITQVVNELKRIPWYNCKINIIASRQHLCINRNLKQLKGRLLDRGCQEMCKQKLCKFKQETKQSSLPLKQWLTLQQLCQKGNKKVFCPFYYSKMATDKCQITIMPFNYLLDWSLFQHNNFHIKNSVIIFDQAHNVDSLAEQGSSLEIDTEILSQALIEIKNLQQSSKCRYLHKKFQNEDDQSDSAYISFAKNLISRFIAMLKQSSQQRNFNCLDEMLATIKKMTNFVNKDREYPGVDLGNYDQLLFDLDKVRKYFAQKKIESQQFQLFCLTLTRIMRLLDSNTNIQDYFMYIGPKNSKYFSIKLNCLNASFTFQRIIEQKPRSILLCSGSLGSFQIWQKQLGMHFQTKIKVPSFITNNQICISIVGQSYQDNIRFQFSYQHKNRQDQFEAFGRELKQIQKVVPNGIVLAFSTYEFMQKAMKFCLGLSKPVFYESKNQNIDQIYLKYSEAAKNKKGAFLFIVMKGKFSEGINFNDQLCRCLIVVGIPFLPPNDFKVVRKQAYIQAKFGREASQQWYYSQTFKAVNQVIGRVIRSKKDYGCVLLFDQRYFRKDILKQLPSWFVPNLVQIGNYRYIDKISKFFTKQPWLNSSQDSSKKNIHDSSFELALSKTILAKQSQNLLGFQNLLNQETPVKIKKPKKMLKISSDDQETFQNITKDELKISAKQLKIKQKQKPKLNQKLNKVQNSDIKKQIKKTVDPWLSLNYFIGEQVNNQLIKQKNKGRQRQRMTELIRNQQRKEQNQQEAILTVHTNKPRNKKYM